VSKTEISDAAIERNRAWIAAITNSLGTRGDSEILRETMRDTGKKCAEQLLKKIIDHFGRPPESVDELIEAINKRRKEVLNASNFWSRDGNKAHFKLEKCGCDLVEAGLAEPNPNFCLCSAGMFESLFARFCKETAKTAIIKAIGFGDNCCEFMVHFEE
jgi:predicted ArsR family transcriptional regulator